MQTLAGAIEDSQRHGRLRAEHFIHLRCEVSAPDVLESFAAFENDARVRIASLMDHTPGQRQFTSLDAFRVYYQGKAGMSDADARGADRHAARAGRQGLRPATARPSPRWRRRAASCSRATTTPPRTMSPRPLGHGVTLAEFPTTHAAAAASHAAGLKVLMGAPNIVRGESHSGNIAARDLVEAGLLDVLSSDYFPFSLIHATFMIGLDEAASALPRGGGDGDGQPGRGRRPRRPRRDRRGQARRPRPGPRARPCAGGPRRVARRAGAWCERAWRGGDARAAR